MAESLRLYNVGWDCRGEKLRAEFYFNTQYHQIGNLSMFAYSSWEAYDNVLFELSKDCNDRHNKITITIPFVEEVKPEFGIVELRETKWRDADTLGDWLKRYPKGKEENKEDRFGIFNFCIPEYESMKCQYWKDKTELELKRD